jgi:hypothetical protein
MNYVLLWHKLRILVLIIRSLVHTNTLNHIPVKDSEGPRSEMGLPKIS